MFRSIFVDGKIANPATGKMIELKVIGEEVLPYLQSIEIELGYGANTNISMVLAPPYDKALELISVDNEWLRLGNTLGLRWGYADTPGAITDWYYGFMQMPQVSFGEDITISVNATTLAWNADRVGRLRDWCTTEPRSFKDVADEIAKKYGLVAKFGDLSDSATKGVEEKVESMVQGGRTDLNFLLMEAERFGLRMIARNQYLYFVSASKPVPGKPDVNATFQMYGMTDIPNAIFPMNSFEPESMGAMFIKNMQGVNALTYGPNDDPAVKKDPVVVTDATSKEKGFTAKTTVANPPTADGKTSKILDAALTAKAIVKVDPNMDEGGRMFTLPLNGAESGDFIESVVSGVNEASADDHGISLSFSSIAVPNLFPGMFVRLEGVGDYFSGTYMLKSVNISIDGSGAEMSCEAFGRGFPSVDSSVDAFFAELKSYEELTNSPDLESLFSEEKKS